MKKLFVLGEILIDLLNDNQNKLTISIGGAPYNLAVSVSKLNKYVTFFGTVGDDFFGDYIKNNKVTNHYINYFLKTNKNFNTTLSICDRSDIFSTKYSFYRKKGADYHFAYSLLDKVNFNDFTIFHLGSLFLSNDNSYKRIIDLIKSLKCKFPHLRFSFDVNYRSDIFCNQKEAFQKYQEIFKYIDILKLSNDEYDFFNKNILEFQKKISNITLILITYGKKGSAAIYKGKRYYASAKEISNPKTTIGAGDTFFGAILASLLGENLSNLNSNLESILRYANNIASDFISK